MKEFEVLSKLKKYFKKNSERCGINSAFLFGSFARGFVKKESDIDIAVVFPNGAMSDKETADMAADIATDLELETHKQVDVIPIYNDFRKPFLYYNAIVLGVPLYMKNRELYSGLYNAALFNMEDFNLFGGRLQLEAAKNILKGV
ncbi:nucleotidyltransferase domain-containing protein [Candidatus Saganbacteria bacterium]|nr:nucleotidyltransferase domain-containing protein [Candidatus Saganbacteria bacterium]